MRSRVKTPVLLCPTPWLFNQRSLSARVMKPDLPALPCPAYTVHGILLHRSHRKYGSQQAAEDRIGSGPPCPFRRRWPSGAVPNRCQEFSQEVVESESRTTCKAKSTSPQDITTQLRLPHRFRAARARRVPKVRRAPMPTEKLVQPWERMQKCPRN